MMFDRRAALSLLGGAASFSIHPAFAQAMAADPGPTDPAKLNAPPVVDRARLTRIANGVHLIADPRINLVPNIGIVEGSDAVLVIDTGLGPANGRTVLEAARAIAGDRRLILTLTHFHPEHGYGAQAFSGQAEIVYGEAQAAELKRKGEAYLAMFRTFGPAVAAALEGTAIVEPDRTFARETVLDLGGRKAVLREMPAHTAGDQVVILPGERIVFCGDLVETRFFPIFPDDDAKGSRWIDVLSAMEGIDAARYVPGHGETGGREIVAAVRTYLERVRLEVKRRIGGGADEDLVDREVRPIIKAAYPRWDNDMWISFAIRVFHAEATGRPLKLPAFN